MAGQGQPIPNQENPSNMSFTGMGCAKVGAYSGGPGAGPYHPPPSHGQWAGDSSRVSSAANVNGYMAHGQAPPPPLNFGTSTAGPNASRPPLGQRLPGGSALNGSNVPHGFPPGHVRPSTQMFHPSGSIPPTQNMTGQSLESNHNHDMGRPNELPVPFHGQGQYSHQVNPLMQKTPTQTPGNSEPPSEKSSRGPSPVSGSTIDALEGQFTPGHGAPSPQFPLNRGSPLSGSPVPSTPPKSTQQQPQIHGNPAGVRPPLPQPNFGVGTGSSIAPGPSSSLAGHPPPPRLGGPRQPMSTAGFPPTETFGTSGLFQAAPGAANTTPPQTFSGFPPTSNTYGHPPATNAPTFPSAANPPGFPPVSQVPGYPNSGQVRPPPPGATPPAGFPPAPVSNARYPLPPTSSYTGYSQPPTANDPRFPAPPASSASGFPPPPTSNTSGYPPPPTSSTPGFVPPFSSASGLPMPPSSSSTGFIPPPSLNSARYPPPPSSNASVFPPSTSTARYPPPPSSNAAGFLPPPPTGTVYPPTSSGYTQPPTSSPFPPPPSSSGTGYPPPPMSGARGPAPSSIQQPYVGVPPATGGPGGRYPTPHYMPQPSGSQQPMGGGYPGAMGNMVNNMGQMGLQDTHRAINLLGEKHLIGPDGVETSKPTLPHDFKKVNCSPDIFRCTLNAIPQTSALLNKARLPLGILIHPFKDLSQLPVIQSSVIVRCRSCRTYINPFVVFVDQRRWKCNLCFRVNELPDEFSFDPVSKTYGDPQRRPEVKSATIEFIAPSEYMLRPPQPAVYLYLLDVSFNAVETGYLSQFCQILLDELDKLPGDARTSIGFLCYDRSLYYFNLAEGLSQPQMLVVPDLEDPFLPCPDNLLVNLHESKELIIELLNQLPSLFEGNHETGSALGAALQSAHKLMSPTGGRVTVMQTCLPTVGPGALEKRECSADSGKNVANIGPATDFYKKLSLDCSAQQIAVDLFMLNGQYADLATLSCISRYSAGCVYYYPSFHTTRNPGAVDKFDADLRRYLTRKIGFESVMRIRCTRGLSIHTFHGNFFVRSTDLLSLPNINPDAGFGMQMSIEDNLQDSSTISFQAALLYTSSKGERRIRVHTLCVPVSNQLSEIFAAADQQAITALLAKMAVDRSLNSAISDARDAMINASLDALGAYAQQLPSSQKASGSILAPNSLRLLPLYMLAMLKSIAFSVSNNSRLDTRVFAMQQCKVLPMCNLVQMLYPHLYPLHKLSDENPIKRGKEEIPSAPLLQLSSANIERTGLFLMDTGEAMYMLVGSAVGDQMCQDVFEKPNFASIPDGMMDLPELENPTSEKIRSFVNYLMDSRPNGVTFLIIRDDSKHRHLFFHHMLEDRTESSMSYYEFLQFLQGKTKG